MASVAKWLRQWFVVPPFVGSSPIVRPMIYCLFIPSFHHGGTDITNSRSQSGIVVVSLSGLKTRSFPTYREVL